MSRLYGGSKKDFGLHNEAELSLPGLHENTASKSSTGTSYYRSAMPDYDVGKQHGGLNISTAPVKPSAQEEAGEKKSRGWFGKGKKSKKSSVPVSVIDDVAEASDMARPSPILRVRAPGRKGGEGESRDQFGRPRGGPEAPEDEEVRMHLSYDAPVDITKNESGLVKLKLRPAGKEVNNTSEVTLRRRGEGFGLHLSTGLPPITVTYVEPGGAAESAGVCVGDCVVEVNGESCEDCEPAKIVALKFMIQQTNVLGDLDNEEEETVASNGITDTAWKQIQARQHQDELQESSRVELTQIDGDSEKEEDVLGKFQDKAGSTEKVQITETEWERMRGQRELVFNKNAPSGHIQHQATRKGGSVEKKPLSSSSSKINDHSREANHQRTPLSSPEKNGTPEKTKTSSSVRGGWFKKKKKETKSEGGAVGVKQKSASLPRSLTGAVVSRGAIERRSTGGGLQMKVTSIDDVEFGGDTENGAQVSDSIKKTFSYEGVPQSPESHVTSPDGHVTSSIPRSRSHNAMFRATLIQAVQQHHSRTPSDDTILASHSRSKLYDEAEEVEGGTREGVGGGRGTEDGSRLGVEERKIETDISRMRVSEEKVDPNLRLTKSGVIKETPKRPTLEVFEAPKVKGDDTTDGPVSPTTPESQDNQPIDLGAIPRTQPSLGRAPGHTRRDLVARSSVKRRLPSKKGTLLLQVDDSQLMGRKRVELSELSPTHRPRSHTMPAKVSRRLIETPPPAFTPPPPLTPPKDTHKEDEIPPRKPPADTKSPETVKIPQELHEGNIGNSSTRGSERESTHTHQNSNMATTTSSSAETVARAVAATVSSSMGMEGEGVKEGGGGVEGSGGGAGSAILARLREEKRTEMEKEKEEETKTEKTTSASELHSRRRNKMVEKPVKSLGIASECDETIKPSPGSTPPQQRPLVHLRKTPSSEFKPASVSSSSSTTPSWVAMAEKKKQRVSALLNKRDSSCSAEPQSPTEEKAPPTLSPISPSPAPTATPNSSTTPLVTKPTELTTKTMKPSPTSHSSPTTNSTTFTKSTPPPTSTKPTTPVTRSTPFKLSSTPKSTSQPSSTPVTNDTTVTGGTKPPPPVTKSTPSLSSPITKRTFPPPSSSPVTKSTPSPSSPITKRTFPPPSSSPVTKSTPSPSSPITKRTFPPPSSSPVTKSTPSTSSPITKSTPSTSASLTKSTPSTSASLTKSTPSTSASLTKSTPSTSASLTKSTPSTSASLTKSTPSTSASLTKSTPSTSAPLTKSTPSTSAPLTKSTPSTSASLTKSTPSTSAPLTKSTPSTSAPLTKSTPSTSAPLTKSTPSTSASLTKSTLFRNSTKSITSEQKEPEEGGRPRKGTVRDRMAFFQK